MISRAVISFWLLILVVAPSAAADAPRVAAASDLRFALTEIAAAFEREGRVAPRLSFGSSGTLLTQIRNGAPFELFLSADENFVFQLADAGLTVDRGEQYAVGHLVLFVPHDSPLRAADGLDGVRAAVAAGRITRFAIANPAHAPYGRAARAALQHAGVWAAIEPALVYGENAMQAMQFAASGSAQGGILPLSLARAPEAEQRGTYALIPATLHAQEALRQRMVLLKRASAEAREFYNYMQSPAARAVLDRHGFLLPGSR